MYNDFFIVNSVILPNNKTMLDPIAKKLILRVSNRKKKKGKTRYISGVKENLCKLHVCHWQATYS